MKRSVWLGLLAALVTLVAVLVVLGGSPRAPVATAQQPITLKMQATRSANIVKFS